MAERAGFEPAVEFPLRQFSKLLLSATQPPLRKLRLHKFLIWATPSKIFLFFLILICKIPVSDLSYNWMCVERNFCLQLQK